MIISLECVHVCVYFQHANAINIFVSICVDVCVCVAFLSHLVWMFTTNELVKTQSQRQNKTKQNNKNQNYIVYLCTHTPAKCTITTTKNHWYMIIKKFIAYQFDERCKIKSNRNKCGSVKVGSTRKVPTIQIALNFITARAGWCKRWCLRFRHINWLWA